MVTDNDDPDKLGRVKVRYPWMDDQQASDWIHVASAFAGDQRGLFFVPQADDQVLVAFAYGRVDRGYVIGSLWSKQDKPPSDGARAKCTIKTRSGHAITLDDTDGSELISIVDKSGKNKITLDAANNKIAIESGGDFSIKAQGKLTIEASDDVSIKGANVTVEASNKLAAKGTQMALNGSAGVNVNDGALEVM
jgi:phage baseplate assembly protein V